MLATMQESTPRTVALPANAIPIERRRASDLPYELFVKEYVKKNKPVVIEGSVPQWKAISEWTPEFFAKQFGTEMVKVTYGVQMPMAEFIEKAVASTPEKPGPYLHQLIIHHHLPALLKWLSPENAYGYPGRFCSPLMPKRCRRPDGYLKLLIGGPGGKFPFMHFDSDNANAVITEIYGEKAFVLYAPEDTPYLYAQSWDTNVSQVDNILHPDLTKFPLFTKAQPYTTVLGPNETIYVPTKWWHAALVVTPSISVCTNMMDATNWSGFVDWICRPRAAQKWRTRAVARVYLTLVGVVLAAAEAVQKALPGTGLARAFAKLSPLQRLSGPIPAGTAPTDSAYGQG